MLLQLIANVINVSRRLTHGVGKQVQCSPIMFHILLSTYLFLLFIDGFVMKNHIAETTL